MPSSTKRGTFPFFGGKRIDGISSAPLKKFRNMFDATPGTHAYAAVDRCAMNTQEATLPYHPNQAATPQ